MQKKLHRYTHIIYLAYAKETTSLHTHNIPGICKSTSLPQIIYLLSLHTHNIPGIYKRNYIVTHIIYLA